MMSLLDNFSGYNQIKVKRADKYKTTFITHWGTFSYERMPFGLSNANVTLQGVVQIVFDDLIDKIIHIYLDDLIVYSKRRSCLEVSKIMVGFFQDRFCPRCKILHSKGFTRAIVFLQH
jgi:hypothetical protein